MGLAGLEKVQGIDHGKVTREGPVEVQANPMDPAKFWRAACLSKAPEVAQVWWGGLFNEDAEGRLMPRLHCILFAEGQVGCEPIRDERGRIIGINCDAAVANQFMLGRVPVSQIIGDWPTDGHGRRLGGPTYSAWARKLLTPENLAKLAPYLQALNPSAALQHRSALPNLIQAARQEKSEYDAEILLARMRVMEGERRRVADILTKASALMAKHPRVPAQVSLDGDISTVVDSLRAAGLLDEVARAGGFHRPTVEAPPAAVALSPMPAPAPSAPSRPEPASHEIETVADVLVLVGQISDEDAAISLREFKLSELRDEYDARGCTSGKRTYDETIQALIESAKPRE